jgi:hypothetical protein
MATITSLAQSALSTTGGTKQWKGQPTLYKNTIDFAEAATAKGSALAAADVIEAVRVPAGSVVDWAVIYVVTALSGGSADETISLGDGGSATRYAAATDSDAWVAGNMTVIVPANVPFAYPTSDTVDLTLAAGATIATAGKLMVVACVSDVNDNEKVGLAQIRS